MDHVSEIATTLAGWLKHFTATHAVPPAPISATLQALKGQLAAIRQRITAIGAELDRLYGSKLYELATAARMAERQGRNLLAEMAARIDTQRELAKTELDAFASSA